MIALRLDLFIESRGLLAFSMAHEARSPRRMSASRFLLHSFIFNIKLSAIVCTIVIIARLFELTQVGAPSSLSCSLLPYENACNCFLGLQLYINRLV